MKTALLFITMVLIGVACVPQLDSDPAPRFDVTLEPSRIAANLYTPPVPTATRERATIAPTRTAAATASPAPTEEATAEVTAVVTEEILDATEAATIEATEAAQPTEEITPQVMPTSNNEVLRYLQDSPTMLVTIEMDSDCFLAGDYIPFRMKALNIATEGYYLYKGGRRLISINNTDLGPQLASSEPSLPDDFANLQPNQEFVWEEEDLGSWVLSLGPTTGIAFTDTGIGLPAGDYWVTFAYTNDQDGLREQPDGSFLIPRAAWRGTAVSFEVRFKVVNDLGEC